MFGNILPVKLAYLFMLRALNEDLRSGLLVLSLFSAL
jgi:hypothetical protein